MFARTGVCMRDEITGIMPKPGGGVLKLAVLTPRV